MNARTVVISGASSGIGRATALRLAGDGWQVFAGVRRLADTPSTTDGRIRPLELDVTDEHSVDAARRHVVGALDGRPLTALINNAGIGLLAPMRTVSEDELRAVWDVNVLGVVRLTKALLPSMGRDGRLLVVGSIGDRMTMPYGGPLTSSKWAVASITEAFRLELAADGIRVTLVEPGSIHSDAVDKVEAAAALTASTLEHVQAARFRRAAAVAVGHERGGSDPSVVADAIARALDAARPPTRVLVGRHARMLATLSLLPDRVFDPLRLRIFQQPRSADAGRAGRP